MDYYKNVFRNLEEISEEELVSSWNPILERESDLIISYLGDLWAYSFSVGKGQEYGDMFKLCARIKKLDHGLDFVHICGIIDRELNLGLLPETEIWIKSDESDESDGMHPPQDNRVQLPHIPISIYPRLPVFLKDLVDLFDSKQDKDLLLLSTLTVLSGCFPNIYGKYDRKEIHLNIYSMIVGAASAGKSVARWSRVILEEIEDEYDRQEKMLFFPADTSFAVLIERLKANDGKGIMFAFEADTLTQNFNQDWGNTTALLRQAYEHERYENMRKGVKGSPAIIHILKKPALTILLTGTPNQVNRLIRDTEDGLFSRFCFYRIELDPTWKSVFPDGGNEVEEKSLDDLLKPFKTKAINIFMAYNDPSDKTFKFDLTKEQKSMLNYHFSEMSARYKSHVTTNAIATIRRQGMVCFRLAGILTAVRMYEKPGDKLIATNEDFETALTLSDVFSHHAFSIARQLPGSYKKQLYGPTREFLNSLPKKFTRKEAESIGEKLGLKENTVERYLENLQPEYIEHPKRDLYRKVE